MCVCLSLFIFSFDFSSAYVAQYTEYTQPLIDHVVQTKLGHWDRYIVT